MTEPLRLSARQGRHLVLKLQGLSESHRRKLDDSALLDLIARMGFVQVDSINIVERAHQMILFSRATGYRPAQLRHMLEKTRDLFENWTHDASIIPSNFFPYWMRSFDNRRERLRARYAKWHGAEFLAETDKVLDRVANHGPIRSRELSPESKKGPGAWWNWHPSKTALEYLWRTGDLAITRRDGFQKAYDLTERVIPAKHRSEVVDHNALVDWACRGALSRLGFGTPAEIAGYWDLIDTDDAKAWCAAPGNTLPVNITQMNGRVRSLCGAPDLEDVLSDVEPPPSLLRLLNPFDPVLRDRKRLGGLFGFDYRIEVFVPAAKRKYGYYVFPLLEGDRMIGRVDMKADRDAACLTVTGFWPEPGIRLSKVRLKKLEAELDRHRRFAGLDRIDFKTNWKKEAIP